MVAAVKRSSCDLNQRVYPFQDKKNSVGSLSGVQFRKPADYLGQNLGVIYVAESKCPNFTLLDSTFASKSHILLKMSFLLPQFTNEGKNTACSFLRGLLKVLQTSITKTVFYK